MQSTQLKYSRPNLQTQYVAPRNKSERDLADIWQNIFGIEQIGIYDNFFELGGDSILSIQIVAKANQARIQLTPSLLFNYQTIAELAIVANSTEKTKAEQGSVTDEMSSKISSISIQQIDDYAPCNFPLAKLNQSQLEQILLSLKPQGKDDKFYRRNLEDIYSLSSMQQEMLFQSQRSRTAGLYFLQFDSILRGKIDYKAFTQAWQTLVDRHQIFRTSFNLTEKVQIVSTRANLPCSRHDWRKFSPTQQQQQLKVFLKEDRKKGFDYTQAPLMRLALIQIANNVHQFVWSCHHALVDGWSFSLILQEVSVLYEQFRQSKKPELRSIRPYRDHIAWLQQQDVSKAKSFWQEVLKDFKAQNILNTNRPANKQLQLQEEYRSQTLYFSTELTSALKSLARQSQITLNNVMEGIWSIFLNKFSKNNDVAFGVCVSGRSADLKNIDSMIGLFVNLLLVRVQISLYDPVLTWLKYLQTKQVELHQYEFTPLMLVHQWSKTRNRQPLFESILRFQNYPTDESLKERLENLTIENSGITDFWSYPLCVVINPDVKMSVTVTYDCRYFDAEAIANILNYLQTLSESLVANPNQRLIELPNWT